jgi:copper transport protein
VLLLVLALVGGVYGTARAHATLLSSEPAAGSTVAASPPRIRLVFSEELEPTLGRITLERASGDTVALAATGDPHDVHALVAPIDAALSPGAYRVIWRVVSADGHPVKGSFVFHVAPPADTAAARAPPPPPLRDESAAPLANGQTAPTHGPSLAEAPLAAVLLRGLAVGALMVLGGLLFFIVAERRAESPPARARRVAGWLSVAAPLLLVAHFLAWVAHTSPTGSLDHAWLRATADTSSGHVELARILFALLVCWALLLARRAGVALTFAAMALAASGAVGHSAAIEPAWAVPAKAVHLLAGAVWAGGIVWLMTLDRSDDEGGGFATRVERVSSVALGAVLAVALSGVVQTRLFLGAWSDLVRSLYGVVVLAKVAGLLALAGFGAYYQRRVIARLADAGVRATFRRLLGREMALMTLVVLLGGLLAYLAPPARPPLPGTASTSSAAAHHPER